MILFWHKSRDLKRRYNICGTYLQELEGLWVAVEKLNVLDLVLSRVDLKEVLKIHYFFNFTDIVLAQVKRLQVCIGSQMLTKFLNLFLCEIQLAKGIRASILISK